MPARPLLLPRLAARLWAVCVPLWELLQSLLLFYLKHAAHCRGQLAHVRTVLARRPHPGPPTPADFLTLHRGFHPLTYLLRPGVTLYWLHGSSVYFVEGPPRADPYDPMAAPLFVGARRLIEVDLPDFMEFAETLGDPRATTVILGHCGGGTVCGVARGLGTARCARVLTHPAALLPPLHEPELRKKWVLRAILRVLCKPDEGGDTELIVINPQPQVTALVSEIHQAAPFVRHVFVKEVPMKTIASRVRLRHSASSGIANEISALQESPPGGVQLTVECLLWARCQRHLVSAAAGSVPHSALRHEDLVADPAGTLQRLAIDLGLEADFTQVTTDDVIKYSDSSTEDAMAEYSGMTKINCDAICDSFQVPRLDSTLCL